ncbi:MAG: hypothetical protein Q9190_003488 [Brigantiaea leucoxantha]
MASQMPSDTVVQSDDLFNGLGQEYEDAFAHNSGLLDTVRQLVDLLPRNSFVLDCGSGTGRPVAQIITESGHRLHGIDVAQTMVDLASKQIPSATFEKANMLEYVPLNKIDCVIAVFSLFQLTRAEISLMVQKWHDWLRPDGLMLIGSIGAEDCHLDSMTYDSDGKCATGVEPFMNRRISVTLFTKASLNSLLEDAGFTLLHTRTSPFSPPPSYGVPEELHYYVMARK